MGYGIWDMGYGMECCLFLSLYFGFCLLSDKLRDAAHACDVPQGDGEGLLVPFAVDELELADHGVCDLFYA